MNFSFNPKKIITVLFGAALFLLLLNIAADKIFPDNKIAEYETSARSVDSIFHSALNNLGFDSLWIKKKKIPVADDSLYAYYLINVPADLPITLILKELNNSYDSNSVSIVCDEKKTGGQTIAKIYSGGNLKLISDFNYSYDIKRKAGTAAFLIDDFDELDEREDSILLYSPEAFAIILTPSAEAVNTAKRAVEMRKEYLIELNDEITELDFKLSSDYSERRLKLSIRSILGSFGKAIFILVDEKSDFYNSSAYQLVKSEFEKRKIKIIKRGSFYSISGGSTELEAKEFLRSINDEESKAAILTAADYMQIKNVIRSFRKVGYKFINPSTVIL